MYNRTGDPLLRWGKKDKSEEGLPHRSRAQAWTSSFKKIYLFWQLPLQKEEENDIENDKMGGGQSPLVHRNGMLKTNCAM